jgi:pimeloyl-ACP methyl ester carboxylesterase
MSGWLIYLRASVWRAATIAVVAFGSILLPSSAAGIQEPLAACSGDLGLPAEARCGSLQVPENRADPKGRRIELNIVTVRAALPAPTETALFVLGGGPGQAVASLAAPLAGLFKSIGVARDLVFVDQRGTGKSNGFNCDLTGGTEPGATGFALPEGQIRKCLDGLNADPVYYTTRAFTQDLDAVRDWLGYERIDLVGGSYGSWAAMAYASWYPEHTNSLVASSVVPPDAAFPAYIESSVERSLNRLTTQCLAVSACRSAHGNTSVRSRTVVERLSKAPVELDGQTITSQQFANAIVQRLYLPATAAQVPELVSAAWSGDYARFAKMEATRPHIGDGVSWGLFLSVTCSEGTLESPTEPPTSRSEEAPFGGDFASNLRRACDQWPHQRVSLDPALLTTSEIPALFLTGAEDPAAPPELAESVMRRYPHALNVVLPGQRHTPVFSSPCALRIMAEFFQKGASTELDLSCVRDLDWEPFTGVAPPASKTEDPPKPGDSRQHSATPSTGDVLAGSWAGSIGLAALGGADLSIEVTITVTGGGYAAELSASVPVTNPKFSEIRLDDQGNVRMTKETATGRMILQGKLNGDVIEGEFIQGEIKAAFELRRKG